MWMPAADTPSPWVAVAGAVAVGLLGLALLSWALQLRRPNAVALALGLLAAAALIALWPAPAAVALVLLAAVAAVVWGLAGRHARLRAGAEALQVALHAQQEAARQAATEGRLQQRQAEEAALAQTRFLAAASHELRSPVQALSLQIEALRAEPLAEGAQATVQRLALTVATLQAMAATLLDVSRIEAGAALPRWDVLPLAPLLRRLAEDTARQAEARGLRLALRLPVEPPITVTDALLLERVLRNLLDNAVKYTQQGGVLLALRRRTATDGATLRLEVWDTGPGVAAADQDRIFQDFQQLPLRGNASALQGAMPGGVPLAPPGQGLGLGLALVRSLVQQLQLRLVLHSRPGRGTVFFIEGLPLAAAAPQRVAAARQAGPAQGPQP